MQGESPIAFSMKLASLVALALFGCSRPDPRAEAESHMKRTLLLLVSNVSESKDLIYPDISTPDVAKTSLQSALAKQSKSPSDGEAPWDESVFIHPSSNSPFVPNANLSNRSRFQSRNSGKHHCVLRPAARWRQKACRLLRWTYRVGR